MPKNGNITGQVFDEEVTDQIIARQIFLGARYRHDAHLLYGNNNNAFIRLASSVNVGTTSNPIDIQVEGSSVNDSTSQKQATENLKSQGINQLKVRKINEKLTGMELAKACVLFGGTVGLNNKLNPKTKFGIVNNNGAANYDYVNTIAAYGWGGISSKGFVPMPSIDSADIGFYNRGALSKATVKIKVYSVEQLQIFDALYFRIGYTMLLEWGHNLWLDSKKAQLPYDPTQNPLKERNEFVTEPFGLFFNKDGTSQQDIIKAIQSQRKKDCYNYDGMLGKVTNFSWNFNDDGSYDITLNLVGLGDVIETLKINTSVLKDPNAQPVIDKNTSADLEKKKESIAKGTQAAENQKTTAGDAKTAAQTTYENTLKAAKLQYNKAYDSLVQLEKAIGKSGIYSKDLSTFSDDATGASALLKRIQTAQSLATSNNRPNIYNTLGIMYTQQSKVTGAEEAKNKADAAADKAIQDAVNAQKAYQAASQNVEKIKETNQLSPITSVETKNKTALNLQLYNWRQDAIAGKNSDNLTKLNFTANSANAQTTGTPTLSLDFYYVRLGYLLDWIQGNILYYDDTKKADVPKTDFPPPGNPIFTIDTNTENNLCLRFPSQFSSDPRICIIPSKYESKDKTVSWDVLSNLKGYLVDNNEYAGRVMNMFVNIDYTASCLDKNTDVNGKTNLLKFLTALMNGINDALGNVNKLEPIFDPESNSLKILEGSSIEKVEKLLLEAEAKSNTMAIFQIYGIGGTETMPKGSFVTDVNFSVQLPPNMASMATISAQSSGNIVGENATGLSALNKGFVDRLITVKLDKNSIEGAQSGKLDPEKIFKENLQTLGKNITELYVNKKFAVDSIESTRSANRDASLYLTGNEALEKNMPAPFFIPFNLSLNMNGLSGMRNYERFSVTEDVLPYSYRSGEQGGVINFLIKGISHTVSNNEWTTKIETLSVSSNRPAK
jgi:hypothetical protein